MRQLRRKAIKQFSQDGTVRQWCEYGHKQSSFRVPAPLCQVAPSVIKKNLLNEIVKLYCALISKILEYFILKHT